MTRTNPQKSETPGLACAQILRKPDPPCGNTARLRTARSSYSADVQDSDAAALVPKYFVRLTLTGQSRRPCTQILRPAHTDLASLTLGDFGRPAQLRNTGLQTAPRLNYTGEQTAAWLRTTWPQTVAQLKTTGPQPTPQLRTTAA